MVWYQYLKSDKSLKVVLKVDWLIKSYLSGSLKVTIIYLSIYISIYHKLTDPSTSLGGYRCNIFNQRELLQFTYDFQSTGIGIG